MSDQSKFYTLAEAARLTGLSTEALRLRIRRGKLEAKKGNDGIRVVLTSADIESIVARKERQQIPTDQGGGPNATKALEEAVATLVERFGQDQTELKAEISALRRRIEQGEIELAAERARATQAEREREQARVQAAAAEGELKGLTAGANHLHEELARMRREVAEAHNRAVTAEQLVLDAVRQREGAEQALARVRKWSFLNFVFGREGKGRQS